MNPSSVESCERGQTIECSKTQEDLLLSRDGEVTHQDPIWPPDEIAEPEPWALASFSDLLPNEIA